MIIDSNIVIYAAQPPYANIRTFIAQYTPAVSAVSYVEVLGYHKLNPTEQVLLEVFFAATTILPITDTVLEQAVKLRQMKRFSLGDALVAGTALAYGRILATRNVDDFKWVPGLNLVNPFDVTP